MSTTHRLLLSLACLPAFLPTSSFAQNFELKNSIMDAEFGSSGLISIKNVEAKTSIDIAQDAWLIVVDDATLSSAEKSPAIHKSSDDEIVYTYELQGYRIEVVYQLKPGWKFVGKQIRMLHAPSAKFTVHRVVPWDLKVSNSVGSDFVPSAYLPQFGETIEQSRRSLPGKDYGEFLRLGGDQGVMLLVQNPFLQVLRDGQGVTIAYTPEMEWQRTWGEFESDVACIGSYRLTGRRRPREMVTEWHLPPVRPADDGADDAEILAYADCVRAFLINAAPSPISVHIGWTLSDYQIDVGTHEGMAEYKRIIDMASQLGIQTVLYAPGNSKLADRTQSSDAWGWEYCLWLNLGEKIRRGEWDPAKDAIPDSVSEILSFAKQKHVGLLAYVYPSVPFAKNPSWIASGGHGGDSPAFADSNYKYATLASREFQDYLIQNLIAFQRRTGIAGYSFDYAWLNLPGSSSYTQWYGWRRVMETLRKTDPSIVIDGRQSYQLYGPWSWLAGSYPHPTGNDESPESFKPFPDLHFDRVSADRMRFVNYWYRNFQFAPEELIPGYASHLTERLRNVTAADGHQAVETMYTRYRPRDWDYLGFRYSFISSIATAGWNNVVNMIPARDPEEARNFSAEDKEWIRSWLAWTVQNKEYLRHTRTILDQPALGHVDGTAAIMSDRGYLFLFNPNYKQMPAEFALDGTIGLTGGERFLLREVYPQKGRLIGKAMAGEWSRGDRVDMQLDGTSATVLELIPEEKLDHPLLFNASGPRPAIQPTVSIKGETLSIDHVSGEPGTVQDIGVLLPREAGTLSVIVNGSTRRVNKSGRYIEVPLKFKGQRFAQAQEITVVSSLDGSLKGTFIVPRRVLVQLSDRKRDWPIPWTPEDYETTWLAPERLLLYVQTPEAKDTTMVTLTVDGQPFDLKPAYSSVRADATCFVGFYADLSKIAPDMQHTIELRAPQMTLGHLHGIFFDNVTPQLTESLEP